MKSLLRLIFALIALMSIIATAPTASADGSGQKVPDCNTDPAACQAMLDQYITQFGPLPEPTPTPAVVSPEIEMTGGQEPPQEIALRLRDYESNLHKIATVVCTDETWQTDIVTSQTTIGRTPAETFAYYETYAWTDDGLVWATEYEEYSTYLQQLADEGYNVKSRPPTLHELVLQFPGCETGQYENPGK